MEQDMNLASLREKAKGRIQSALRSRKSSYPTQGMGIGRYKLREGSNPRPARLHHLGKAAGRQLRSCPASKTQDS